MALSGDDSDLQVVPELTLQPLQADKIVVLRDNSDTATTAQPALRRICRLAPETIWLLVVGFFAVMAAVVGGSLGGGLSKHNNANANANAPNHPLGEASPISTSPNTLTTTRIVGPSHSLPRLSLIQLHNLQRVGFDGFVVPEAVQLIQGPA